MTASTDRARYRAAGVDVEAGYRAVELMREHIAATHTPGVLSDIGGFGGLFRPELGGMAEPILVSGTDGVGTKLRIAQQLGRHDTIGIDCVAMCVNDIVCSGASPLFFLDYLAVGRNQPERVAEIVSGVAAGCVQSGCALIGGETAEMPGFYAVDEYDIAGFAVGLVDRSRIIDGTRVEAGDAVIGLASSGVHSNGFSLVRQVIADAGVSLDEEVEALGTTVGLALLEPTRIYVRAILALREAVELRAVAHITGGGWHENMPRCLPRERELGMRLEREALPVPPIFDYLARLGAIPEEEMYRTFNMGVGMIAVVPAAAAAQALASLEASGEKAAILGEVTTGGPALTLV